jgi:hypothetical protein
MNLWQTGKRSVQSQKKWIQQLLGPGLALLALPLAGSWAWAADPASPQAVIEHRQKVRAANQLLTNWKDNESWHIKKYLAQRGQPSGPNEDFDISIDTEKIPLRPRSNEDLRRDDATQELVLQYYGHQGLNRYHGTFIESGAAFTGDYQWNTQRWAGFAVKKLRDQFLDQAQANQIYNIRFGINLHELDLKRPQTLDAILDFHREAWRRGISLTDSIMFFSGLKELEVRKSDGSIDADRSYQNNPMFPDFAEKRAEFILSAIFREQALFNEANAKLPLSEQKPMARTAVNPINEPETFAGFNHFWNNGLAPWGEPNTMQLYVKTIINIARANVRIRMATERASQRYLGGERVLFFHNEAMTPENYPSHRGDLQFAVSKLMLGDDQLMNADFSKLTLESLETMRARFEARKRQGEINVVEACILYFSQIPLNDTPEKQERARRQVIAQLRELRSEHLYYTRMTQKLENGRIVHAGKTAKTDTILMLDYYQQSEFILPTEVAQLIEKISQSRGEALKEILGVNSDEAVLSVLQERTRQAELATGQKIWPSNVTSLNSLDLQKLLSQEDGIVLEKLVGLRSEWSFNQDPIFAERRTLAQFNIEAINKTDEKRLDFFMNQLLAGDASLLKVALKVQTSQQLFAALQEIGFDTRQGGPQLQLTGTESLREILNLSERTILYRAFGLERQRRLGFLPTHYARQMRAQLRKGFYKIFLNYFNETGIGVVGQGEDGTPFPWHFLVHKQQNLSLVAAAEAADLYIVRHDVGAAVGTVGWMAGPMTGDLKSNGRRGEDGIFKLVRTGPYQFSYELSSWQGGKPWYTEYRQDFEQGLARSQDRINNFAKPLRCSTVLERR